MRPSIRNSDKEERAIFYQIMRCMQLPLARSDTLVGWTQTRTRTRPERVALPIPSNIVPSSQFPVPCSFNPIRNRNRNPTQRTYNLSASNGNQTVAGRVSEKADERESATATTITMPAIPIRIKMLPLRMRMCQQRMKERETVDEGEKGAMLRVRMPPRHRHRHDARLAKGLFVAVVYFFCALLQMDTECYTNNTATCKEGGRAS